jgi:hypothetical protein
MWGKRTVVPLGTVKQGAASNMDKQRVFCGGWKGNDESDEVQTGHEPYLADRGGT